MLLYFCPVAVLFIHSYLELPRSIQRVLARMAAFKVTRDITDLTCASSFQESRTHARTVIHFSTASDESGISGSPDTARDSHGFAIKIRTDEGNLDCVFNQQYSAPEWKAVADRNVDKVRCFVLGDLSGIACYICGALNNGYETKSPPPVCIE